MNNKKIKVCIYGNEMNKLYSKDISRELDQMKIELKSNFLFETYITDFQFDIKANDIILGSTFIAYDQILDTSKPTT